MPRSTVDALGLSAVFVVLLAPLLLPSAACALDGASEPRQQGWPTALTATMTALALLLRYRVEARAL